MEDNSIAEGEIAENDTSQRTSSINPLEEARSGVPTLELEFESDEEAYKFYNEYAMKVGFGTKIRKTRKNAYGVKYYVKYTCNKEGFKEIDDKVKKQRPATRCGCPAEMEIRLLGSKKWTITGVELEHNHCMSPSKSRYFRSHKRLPDGVKRKLELSAKKVRGTSQTFEEIAKESGVKDQLTFGLKDCSNHLSKMKAMELSEGDADAMMTFFDNMLAKDQNFFYAIKINSVGSLVNVFWVDPRSRAAYEYFSDVVTFDTTYLTNKYKLKFAPFVGVNHHGQTILLGCGLLANETIKSFVWLFQKWLMAMRNRAPNAIISDQSEAIQAAVVEVFPNSHYRLCLWHIMKNVPHKLSGLNEYKEIKRKMKKVVYESLRVSDFEQDWGEMICKYRLENNKWLNTLYDLREKWVPVFLKGTFWAGMSTTQRSESMDAFFDKYVDAKTSLKHFVERYELALNDKYEKECIADHNNSEPPLKLSHSFEKQLSQIYTHNIFKKFQMELILGLSRCYGLKLVREEGVIRTYTMKERVFDKNDKPIGEKEYEVYCNNEEMEVTCLCNMFEFKGYLCRHVLHTLSQLGVYEIPPQYIKPRWRKDFKRVYSVSYGSREVSKDNPVERYEIVYHRFIQFVEQAAMSKEACEVALEVLRAGEEQVRAANSGSVGDILTRESIHHIELCEPYAANSMFLQGMQSQTSQVNVSQAHDGEQEIL